ncbi:MAG: hypothetical protein B9J98_04450 [Candidatus Terraquivivens tikiterensis]|uniref:Uncharacterized protein n=1 Tax=Candidatus Terraquivivens tikiterensis TaxID=1980982 RepID=A0A2R7Y3H7_9ARCH|nr:MAG: hypothetical protein B9J98_04450 [Candidatus Terraquivivens tikiterensis]
MGEKDVCPRCGGRISYYERRRDARTGRIYVYAAHYEGYTKVGRKVRKKVSKCYLGPAESYEYVSRTHFREGLILRGLADSDRAVAYIDSLISYITNTDLNDGVRRTLGAKFTELGRKLLEGASVGKE